MAEAGKSSLLKKLSIQLAVSDLDTTEAFYTGILGVPLTRILASSQSPECLIMEQNDWNFVFNEEDAVIEAHPVLEESLGSFPKGVGVTFHFQVEDIEEIFQALIDEDMEILYPLQDKPYGCRELWCFDPDGYLVVLAESLM